MDPAHGIADEKAWQRIALLLATMALAAMCLEAALQFRLLRTHQEQSCRNISCRDQFVVKLGRLDSRAGHHMETRR